MNTNEKTAEKDYGKYIQNVNRETVKTLVYNLKDHPKILSDGLLIKCLAQDVFQNYLFSDNLLSVFFSGLKVTAENRSYVDLQEYIGRLLKNFLGEWMANLLHGFIVASNIPLPSSPLHMYINDDFQTPHHAEAILDAKSAKGLFYYSEDRRPLYGKFLLLGDMISATDEHDLFNANELHDQAKDNTRWIWDQCEDEWTGKNTMYASKEFE